MDYKRIYDIFVADRKAHPTTELYSNLHHIIPLGDGGKDCEENLVRLSIRDHQFAHKLIDRFTGRKACPEFTRFTAKRHIAALQKNGIDPKRAKRAKAGVGKFRLWLNDTAKTLADDFAQQICEKAAEANPGMSVVPFITKQSFPIWLSALNGLSKHFVVSTQSDENQAVGPAIKMRAGEVIHLGMESEIELVVKNVGEYLKGNLMMAITDGVARAYAFTRATEKDREMFINTATRMMRITLGQLKATYRVIEIRHVYEVADRYVTRVVNAAIIDRGETEYIDMLTHPVLTENVDKVFGLLTTLADETPVDPVLGNAMHLIVKYALDKYVDPGYSMSGDLRKGIVYCACNDLARKLATKKDAIATHDLNVLTFHAWREVFGVLFGSIADAEKAAPGVPDLQAAYRTCTDEGLHDDIMAGLPVANDRITACLVGMVAAKLRPHVDDGMITQEEFDFAIDPRRVMTVILPELQTYTKTLKDAKTRLPLDQFAKKCLFGYATAYSRKIILYMLGKDVTEETYGRIADIDEKYVTATFTAKCRLNVGMVTASVEPGACFQLPVPFHAMIKKAIDDISMFTQISKAKAMLLKSEISAELGKRIMEDISLRRPTSDQFNNVFKVIRLITAEHVQKVLGGDK